ncbi:C2 calcium-dependent domain-containing protein 4A isoform X1 [Cricetulus griseus]|uniref:C2 calcium-dependent domain-containing protein 4A isoform X1 n=1 Tax=Cricetulus griseus TaxID=10029 RepID=UPI0004544616|nr:C2 calcium-dependent domain-containing protein 4A isoform X1 [Cricetulus griseus]
MWCLEQLLRNRDGFLPGRARRTKAHSSAACMNVLTPDRIPEFCIPPRLEPSTSWAALSDAWAADSETLRLRLLRAEGLAAALEPRALGCRLSLVLQQSGQQRASVLRRSRKAALDQDCCFDGLSEEQLRRLSVRIKAESKGRGLERGRPLGQGELLLGSLLLL